MKDAGIIGIAWKPSKELYAYYLTRKYYPIYENNHMRFVSISLKDSLRVFKRRLIQRLLKEGNIEEAKLVGRARLPNPLNRETCMGTHLGFLYKINFLGDFMDTTVYEKAIIHDI